MGNFDDHMRYGAFSYLLVLIAFMAVSFRFEVLVLGALASGLALPFTFLGAAFPDVDHHSSKPHRWLRQFVFVSVSLVAGYFFVFETRSNFVELAARVEAPLENEALALIGAVVSAFLVGGIGFLLIGVLRPKHRGITHTLRTGFVMSSLAGAGSWYAAFLVVPEFAFVLGGGAFVGFFFGFLSHLQCDGLLVGFLPDAM